jgi:hypothetical protein
MPIFVKAAARETNVAFVAAVVLKVYVSVGAVVVVIAVVAVQVHVPVLQSFCSSSSCYCC